MSSFVIINNSFSVKRPHLPAPQTKMHEITSLAAYMSAAYNFQIFRGSISPDPPQVGLPLGRIGPRLNLCRLLCFIGRRPVKTSAKNQEPC